MPFGSNIDDLLSPLKQRLHDLQKENEQLKSQLQQARQELADLQRGIGITVLVNGKPVPTGANVPLEALPTHAPAPGYGRPFATPAVLNDRRPPDVVPLPPAPGNYPPAQRGPDTPTGPDGRRNELAKHFLD
jgi:hypothetical protein